MHPSRSQLGRETSVLTRIKLATGAAVPSYPSTGTLSWFDLQGNLGPAGQRSLTGSLSLDDDSAPVIYGYLRSANFTAQGTSYDYSEVYLLADGTVSSSGTQLDVDDTDITSVELQFAQNGASFENVAGVNVPASADFRFLVRPEGASAPGSTTGYDGLLDYELGEWWLEVELGSPTNAVLIHLEGELVSQSLP